MYEGRLWRVECGRKLDVVEATRGRVLGLEDIREKGQEVVEVRQAGKCINR